MISYYVYTALWYIYIIYHDSSPSPNFKLCLQKISKLRFLRLTKWNHITKSPQLKSCAWPVAKTCQVAVALGKLIRRKIHRLCIPSRSRFAYWIPIIPLTQGSVVRSGPLCSQRNMLCCAAHNMITAPCAYLQFNTARIKDGKRNHCHDIWYRMK